MAARPSTPRPALLATIWIGMPVVDLTGRLIGSVKYVRRPAPLAGIAADPADAEVAIAFAHALTEHEPTIATTLTEQFVRNGFLKVTGAGLMDNDLYVLANQIATADEDAVRLSCAAIELAVERENWV